MDVASQTTGSATGLGARVEVGAQTLGAGGADMGVQVGASSAEAGTQTSDGRGGGVEAASQTKGYEPGLDVSRCRSGFGLAMAKLAEELWESAEIVGAGCALRVGSQGEEHKNDRGRDEGEEDEGEKGCGDLGELDDQEGVVEEMGSPDEGGELSKGVEWTLSKGRRRRNRVKRVHLKTITEDG